MEKQEEKLIEKILGRDFLNAAKTYGASMRQACALQGASENVQSSMERIASVAFAKGASYLKETMWVKLENKYPRLNTWVLCKGDDDSLFIAKFVKTANGGIKAKNTSNEPTGRVVWWMDIPEVEDEKGKEVAQ